MTLVCFGNLHFVPCPIFYLDTFNPTYEQKHVKHLERRNTEKFLFVHNVKKCLLQILF